MIESSNDAFSKRISVSMTVFASPPSIWLTVPEDICKKDILITEALGEYLMVFQWTMSLQLDGEILLGSQNYLSVEHFDILSFVIF